MATLLPLALLLAAAPLRAQVALELPPDFLGQLSQAGAQIRAAAQKAAEKRERDREWWKPLEERRQALDRLRDAVEPSVLEVHVGRGAGTAFIVDPSGLVMTADHVISSGGEITLKSDHVKPVKAKVVARAPERDIALLQIEGDRKDWPALPFADMSGTKRAHPVYAFGNGADYGISIHEGLVQRCENDAVNPYATCVQSSSTIGPGDSGGPLVNVRGEVVGMNAMIPGNARDISFSTHGDLLKKALAEYRKTKDLADYGLDAEFGTLPTRDGLLLVVRAAPAASTLKSDDVVESVDGSALPSDGAAAPMDVLKRALAGKGKDGKVSLVVRRPVRKADGSVEETRETLELPMVKRGSRAEAPQPRDFLLIR